MAKPCTEESIEETRLISRCDDQDEDDETDEEEEALSLCDLPVNISRKADEFGSRGEESQRIGEFHEACTKPQEDFDFGFDSGFGSSLRVGSDSADPAETMSTADELFFKGRILPLRHSVSLDAGFPGWSPDSTHFLSRSESVDYRRTGSFASGGSCSRSSSCRSHYSSGAARAGGSDRKMKNNFINFSHPSPQPQMIRRTSSLTARVSTSRNSKSSSIWDFLRLGLVRAPEIELQDLKLRTNAAAAGNTRLSVSRNSSCSSTSTSGHSSNKNKIKNGRETKTRKQKHGSVFSDRKRGFLFGDCRCSSAAEAIPLKNSNIFGESVKKSAAEEEEEEEKQRRKKTKEEKVAMARKRTFEWLKELSQASFVDHGRSLS